MNILDVKLNDDILNELLSLSLAWEKEDCCYGYVANKKSDFENKRIFIVKDDNKIIAYLLGSIKKASNMNSIIKDNEKYFELDELYVLPKYRLNGIGKDLYNFAEQTIKKDNLKYIFLSTASKNYKAILHFYIDIVGMNLWSAKLYKKI